MEFDMGWLRWVEKDRTLALGGAGRSSLCRYNVAVSSRGHSV